MKLVVAIIISIFPVLLIFADGAPTPGITYFPVTSDDWAYMAKYHSAFSDNQRTRAAYQALAMKLDNICNCGVVERVRVASNNEGRFWEDCWKSWQNNNTENQRILDIIIATIDNMGPRTTYTPPPAERKPFRGW